MTWRADYYFRKRSTEHVYLMEPSIKYLRRLEVLRRRNSSFSLYNYEVLGLRSEYDSSCYWLIPPAPRLHTSHILALWGERHFRKHEWSRANGSTIIGPRCDKSRKKECSYPIIAISSYCYDANCYDHSDHSRFDMGDHNSHSGSAMNAMVSQSI
jgi:hypothetical protein